MILYVIFFSPTIYLSILETSNSGLKNLVNNSFASITAIFSPVYLLKVSKSKYSIFFPTARAVLDGSVQGVVVQAKKYICRSVCLYKNFELLFCKSLN